METLTNLTELYVDEEWRSSYCPRGGLARFWKPRALPCHLYKVIIQIVRINPVSFLVSAVLRNCLCQSGMTRNSTCTFSFLLGKASSAQQVVQQPEGRVVCLSGLPEWCWPFWVPEGEGSFRDNMHAQRCRTRLVPSVSTGTCFKSFLYTKKLKGWKWRQLIICDDPKSQIMITSMPRV